MIRALSLSLLLLPACKVELAPVPDSWDAVVEDQGRTSLGDRITLDASSLDGVSGFGEHIAVSGGKAYIVETADGLCSRRIRSVDLETPELQTQFSNLETCEFADATFGDGLQIAGTTQVTGRSIRWHSSWQDPAELQLLEDEDPVLVPWVSSERWSSDRRVFHGQPAANTVHILNNYHYANEDRQIVLATPAHLSDQAGYGTRVHVLDDVVIVEDAYGHAFFHYLDDSGYHPNWTLGEGPAVDGILAVQGNEILAQRTGMADLEVLRYDRDLGTWTQAATLTGGATAGYTQWVLDDVAAFALLPREGNRRGVIDRYNRLNGELEGSLSLVRPHDRVEMVVEGDHLVVSEFAGEDGVVHIFDWREERKRLHGELGGLHEDYCFVPEHTVQLDEHPTSDPDVFQFVGNVGELWEDGEVVFDLDIPVGDSVELTLVDPWGDDPENIEVEIIAGDDVTYQLNGWDRQFDENGAEHFLWHNFNDWNPQIRVSADYLSGSDTCDAFDLRVKVVDRYNFCADEHEGNDGEDVDASDLPNLLSIDRLPLALRGDDTLDRFFVEVPPGATLEILQVEGDVPVRLYQTWSSSPEARLVDGELLYTNESTQHAEEFVVEVEHYGAYAACRPYSLATAIRLPAAEPNDSDLDD